MSGPLGRVVWVFHAGALGDHVMIWPLVRAIARQGTAVTAVAAASHARLCERIVGGQVVTPGMVRGVDGEQRRFSSIWAGCADVIDPDATMVLSFVADEATDAGRVWMGGAARAFPGASIVSVGPPGSSSRAETWRATGVERHGRVSPAPHDGGRAVLFIGAGGERKRWPLSHWLDVRHRLRTRSIGAMLAIGPVECERMAREERSAFDGAGGVVLGADGELDPLVDAIAGARLFIGADTGPTHLAAQMGVATIVLFGPTDPAVWSPVGPGVRVLAPPTPRPMAWLSVGVVAALAEEMCSRPAVEGG